MRVRIHYDPAKNERNIRERTLPFDLAVEFEFESAQVRVDTRRDYGEARYVALGMLRGRLHVLCFTDEPDGVRIISFRKANSREMRLYAKEQAPD